MNIAIVSCSSCGKKNRIQADKQHLFPKCGHCKTPINMTNQAIPIELGDQNFHDFVKQVSLPVMVDFFSPTCGPCQRMLPIVNAMAREHANRFIIATVDTSKNQGIALFFDIRSVPRFIFFKNGSLIDQISGAVSKDILEKKLTSLEKSH